MLGLGGGLPGDPGQQPGVGLVIARNLSMGEHRHHSSTSFIIIINLLVSDLEGCDVVPLDGSPGDPRQGPGHGRRPAHPEQPEPCAVAW